jgi:hypothetical protein
MDRSVFSSLSRCSPSSQGMSLCRSSLDRSFGVYLHAVFAYVLIFQRCFFLKDLRRRSRPPTVASSWCQIVFRKELDPWKIFKALECRRSEKHLHWARCRETIKVFRGARWPTTQRVVVHRSAGAGDCSVSAGDLAIHLPTCSTI